MQESFRKSKSEHVPFFRSNLLYIGLMSLSIILLSPIFSTENRARSQAIEGLMVLVAISNKIVDIIETGERQAALIALRSDIEILQANQDYIRDTIEELPERFADELVRGFIREDMRELRAIMSALHQNMGDRDGAQLRNDYNIQSLISRMDRLVFKLSLYEESYAAPIFAEASMLQYWMRYGRSMSDPAIRILLQQHQPALSRWLDGSVGGSIPQRIVEVESDLRPYRYLSNRAGHRFAILEHVLALNAGGPRQAVITRFYHVYSGMDEVGEVQFDFVEEEVQLTGSSIEGRYRSRRDRRAFVFQIGDSVGLETFCVESDRDDWIDMELQAARSEARRRASCIESYYQDAADEMMEITERLDELEAVELLLENLVEFNRAALETIGVGPQDAVDGQ